MPSHPNKGRAPSVRSVLREQTDDIHQLLHRHSSFVALFNQNLKADEYQRLIERLFGFYAPLDDAVEALISNAGSALHDYGYTRRSTLLGRDLLDLGVQQSAIDALPRCPQTNKVVTPETLGGVLYVVEGATLGGSVIERALSKTLRADGPEGKRYWAWCREEGKYCWSKLNAYLDGLEVDDQVLKDHLTGAQETFRVFAEWLEPLNQTPALKLSA